MNMEMWSSEERHQGFSCILAGLLGIFASVIILGLSINEQWLEKSLYHYIVAIIVFFLMTIFSYIVFSKVLKIDRFNGEGRKGIIIAVGIYVMSAVLMYGMLKADDGYVGADVSGFFWHIIPKWIIILIVIAISLCFFLFILKETGKTKSKMFYLFYFAMSVAWAGTAVYLNCFSSDTYHIDAYLHPIYNVYFHEPYSELSYSIYGHYELFYLLPMKIFGTSPVVICALIFIVAIISAMFILLTVHELTESAVIRCLIPFALLVPTGCMFMTSSYQSTPHRIFFPAMLIFYCTKIAKDNRQFSKKEGVFGFIICSLGVLWNTETGIFCCIAWAAYIIIQKLQEKKMTMVEFMTLIVRLILLMILEILAAIVIVNIYNFYVGGPVFIKEFFYPYINSSFMNNYIIPVRFGNYPYIYILALALAAITYGTSKTRLFHCTQYDRKAGALVATGVIILGQLSYYITRAAYYALLITFPFVVILIAFFSNTIIKYSKELLEEKRVSIQDGIKIGIASSCIMAIAMLCLMCTSITTCYAQNFANEKYFVKQLKDEVKQLENRIEPNTYAVGWGTDEIYGLLGWNTNYHMLGTTDVLVDQISNAAVFSVLKEEANSQDSVFLANSAYTEYPILGINYSMKSQFELFGSKYAHFINNMYKKMVKCSKYSELTADASFFIDDVIDCGEYYSINGWFYINGENVETEDCANAVWGLKNLTTDEVYMLDFAAVLREDISKTIADGHNYNYAGLYGRIAKDEIDIANNKYEIVIIYGEDNYQIKGTGRMLIQ